MASVGNGSITALLAEAERRGLHLEVADGNLTVQCDPQDDDLAREIISHRDEVRRYLNDEPDPDSRVPTDEDNARWNPHDGGLGSAPDGCISNARCEVGDDGKEKAVALTMQEILAGTRQRTDSFPRRVGSALFIHDQKHGVAWLDNTEALFAWLHSRVGRVLWKSGAGMVKQAELFAEFRRTSQAYVSVENAPHFPPVDGHYYSCGDIKPGDGSTLATLLDRFTPATPIDRDLMQAAFVTPAWGGPPGARPVFVVTSDNGRGAGKTSLVKAIARVWGGELSFSPNEDIGRICTRLLSPDALPKRVVLVDNIKSLRFSSGDLESLVTGAVVGGHRMYVGEATRPNTLTWCYTLNGASLSTDLAQRSVIVKVKRPDRSANWEEETFRFIDENRDALIADCIGFLQSEPFPLAEFSRWASWEKDILQRLPEPGDVQQVIIERQGVADAEADDAGLLQDYIAEQLAGLHYSPDEDQVFIPTGIIGTWFNRAHNDRQKTGWVSRIVGQFIDEGRLPRIRRTGRSWGRGFVWCGPDSDPELPVRLDIAERLRRAERDT
jgi:hypothetical protein